MTSFQARRRDPLFDENTQAILERRGTELIGVILILLGGLMAMLLFSYAPEDPSWLAASDQPVHNWLGRIGAGIASPLVVIVGHGAWLLPVGLLIWGGRLVTHRCEDRLWRRITFFPIGMTAVSVYAAMLVPGDNWGHGFGLGGHFGDMVAGALLGIVPVSGAFGLKLLSLVLAVAMLAMGAFVLGFTRPELRAIARFMWLGTVAMYVGGMNLLGKGAQASVHGARAAAAHAAEKARQRRSEAAEPAVWDEQQVCSGQQCREDHGYAQPGFPPPDAGPRGSLLSRIQRHPEPDDHDLFALEPELVEPHHRAGPEAAPSEDRIRARIAQAVQNHKVAPTVTAEPALSAGPAQHAPVATAPEAPVPASVPSSVLAAVARRLQRASRQPQICQTEPPLRAEPPLHARARFTPPSEAASGHVAPDPEEPGVDQSWLTMSEQIARDESATGRDWTHPDWTVAEAQPIDDDAEYGHAPDARDHDANTYWTGADTDEMGDEMGIVPELPPVARGLDRQVIKTPDARPRVVQPVKKPAAPSRRAREEAEPKLSFDAPVPPAVYEPPPLSLLTNPSSIQRHQLSDEALEENARMLETVLDDYGVRGEIASVRPGPVVTMYELEPAPGLKASRVIGLADDIARSMSALSARVSTVPGRSVIGIELPNDHREKVVLREILAARDFGDANMKLPLALGKTIGGEPIVTNLAKMPHLLIAGTTGSGKSVAINTMILSLLYRLTPEECRLIMIDPKMLELSVYDGIPHLLSPVVTDPKKAVVALKWVVCEMEDRYRKMSRMGVRNIEGYNGRVQESLEKGEMFKRTVQTGFDEETGDPVFETDEFQPRPFPYIVVIVDEMADLMMVAGKEIEACIQRLAQMARASGIHLIMATQRPSVDVITGTIKANFPTRISFQVTSKIDSRTILGEQGAEQLLGMGDMLYMAGGGKITRCHGPFVSDEEVEEIVNHLKSFGPPEYMSGVVEGPDNETASDIDTVLGLNAGGNTGGEDALYDQVVAIVIKDRKCSTSYIQRKLGIGYNKAARLVEQMEDQGVVSSANHVGKREILVPEQ